MSAAQGFAIKGRCPGALQPMASGDGLIVRVRPWCGSLAVAALAPMADAAQACGNGIIELTRRANIQIRGVRPSTLVDLLDRLNALGLVDDDPAIEAIRNIVLSPLAGIDPEEHADMRPVAEELTRLLTTAPLMLKPKFGFVLDGGGRLRLDDVRADVRLVARPGGDVTLSRAGMEIETVACTAAAAAAYALASRRTAAVARRENPSARQGHGSRLGLLALAQDQFAVGAGVAFGQMDCAQLAAVAAVLEHAGIREVRLAPWRAFYCAADDHAAAERLVTDLARLGLIVDGSSPLARTDACPGAPACASAQTPARDDARVLAAIIGGRGLRASLHVSGCAKGCARSAAADLTLVGTPDGYDVVVGGTARDAATAHVASDRLDTIVDLLARAP